MAREKTVHTACGTLIVSQSMNANDQVTGRTNGVTYVGASWADVERQIQAAFAIEFTWVRYIVFRTRYDFGNTSAEWIAAQRRGHEVDVRFEWATVEVSQPVTRPKFGAKHGMESGFMVLREGNPTPVFHAGETVHNVLGPCVPWTPENETFARDIVDRLRATAIAIETFFANPDLARSIVAATTARVLQPPKDSP